MPAELDADAALDGAGMSSAHARPAGDQTETRCWRRRTVDDAGVTIHTARADLAGGIVVERVTTCDRDGCTTVDFISDAAGCEITLRTGQSAELSAALGELDALP